MQRIAFIIRKNPYIVPVFLLFLTVRLFSGNAHYLLTGDACKYLTLARNFPFHTLYNHSLYLIHSPVFAGVIGFFGSFMPLYPSGITVTLIFAVGTFWVTRNLAVSYGLGKAGVAVALLYVSLSAILVTFDSHVSRSTILTFLMLMSLLNFHEFLKAGKRKYFYLAMVFCALTLLTSEQGIFLIPSLMVQYFFCKRKKQISGEVCIFGIVAVVAFCVWPVTRLVVYSQNVLYPAGIDGTVETMSLDSIWPIINPNFFPNTSFHTSNFGNFSFSWQHLRMANFVRYMGQVCLVPYAVSFYFLVVAMVLMGLRMITNRDLRMLELALITAFLFFPCFFGMHLWYGVAAIIPFGVCLGRLALFRPNLFLHRKFCWLVALAVVCLMLSLFWLFSGKDEAGNSVLRIEPGCHFLYTRPVITPGQQISKHLKIREDDGVMAPIGLVPEMAFLTKARCLALPLMPQLLDKLVEVYNVRYLVFSEDRLRLSASKKDSIARSSLVVNLIAKSPHRYREVARWHEDYPDGIPSRTFYVYTPVAAANAVQQADLRNNTRSNAP